MNVKNKNLRSWFAIFLGTALLVMALGMMLLIVPANGATDPWILYDYETDVEGWAPDGAVGSVAHSTQHATRGSGSLEINSTGGHFEGRPTGTDTDWTGWEQLVLDIYSPISTTTHVAFKTGSGWTWQQTPDYQLITGTNTITVTFGVDITLNNPNDVRSLLVFYSPGVFYQDNVHLVGYTPPPPTPTPTNTATLGPTPTPVVNLPGLRVIGPNVYDTCGEKILLRGVNKMVTWTDPTGDSFHEIAKTGANSVRIVWLPEDDPADLDLVLQKAIDNGLIPMVGLWNTTGQWSELIKALEYWLRPDVISVVQKYEQFMLLNVGNEAGDASITPYQFKETYRYIVLRLRDAGIHTPIVIDASDWGKDINMLQAVGPYLQSMDPDHNIIFDIHTYWPYKWGWSDEKIISEFAEFADLSLPLVVGEFGNKWDGDGSVGDEIPYQLIIQLSYEYGFGVYPWEWGPGNNPQTHLNMTDDSMYDTLHDWGLDVAVTNTYSILNTSNRPYSLTHNGACASGATATPGPTPLPYNNDPVVSITAPDFNAMLGIPANTVIQASASDLDGTISKVEFYANGMKIGEDSVAPYTTTFSTAITGEYWLNARAIDDMDGNGWSSFHYVIVGTPAHFSINDTITTNISDTLSDLYKFYYTGTWNLGLSPGTGRFHDDDHYSDQMGASFEISFYGTQIELHSSLAPHHGIAGAILDGQALTETIDMYSPTNVSDGLVWSSDVLPLGDHTLVITVTGQKNASSTGTTVTVDRVRITTGETAEYRSLRLPLVFKGSTGQITSPPTPTPKPPTPTLQPTNTLIVPTRTPWPTSTPTTPVPIPTEEKEGIYHDALGSGWDSWSWGVTLDFAGTTDVYTGTNSITATYSDGGGALSLHHDVITPTVSGIDRIIFYANGNGIARPLYVYTQDDTGGGESTKKMVDVPATGWTKVEVLLSELGSPAKLTRVNIQNRSGDTTTPFYLDEIILAGPQGAMPPTYLVLNDFETDTEGWQPGASVVVTTTHATHGSQALQINSSGGWFNDTPPAPVDVSSWRFLEFDIYNPGSAGSVDVAIQTGSGWDWQQSPKHYTLDAGTTTHVIVDLLLDFNSGSGLTNPNTMQQINIYFNAGTYVLDYVILTSPPALYSFETDTQGWGPGGSVAITTTHVTLGSQALQIDSVGGWFAAANLMDFAGKRYLIFHVYNPGSAGSVDVAIQTGSGWDWQQSPKHYTILTNDVTLVVVDLLTDFNSGSGLTNPDTVQQINIYFNAGTYVLDYVAVE